MEITQEIYKKYRIMPSLQLHQLRVAAVGKLICDNFQKAVDSSTMILACLFHDMGNIIKADLAYFPEFVEPEGLMHWEQVQSEFISKYGANHHAANVAIAKEIGLPVASVKLIDSISFSKIADVVADDSVERKIMQYADLRVGPHGILSLQGRLVEGRKRYTAIRAERTYYESDMQFEKLAGAAAMLEKQVFADTKIKPEDITDTVVEPVVEELRNYAFA